MAGIAPCRADIVHDHSQNRYGKIISLDETGVRLASGCNRNSTVLISLSDLEELEFNSACVPTPIGQKPFLPGTAFYKPYGGCTQVRTFTVVAGDDSAPGSSTLIVVYAKSVKIDSSGQVYLVLTDGRELGGTTTPLRNIGYSTGCLEDLPPNPPQASLSGIFQPTAPSASLLNIRPTLRLFPVVSGQRIPPPLFRSFSRTVYWNQPTGIFLQVDCRIPGGALADLDMAYTYIVSAEGQPPLQRSFMLHIARGSQHCQGIQPGFTLDARDVNHTINVDLYDADQRKVGHAELDVLP